MTVELLMLFFVLQPHFH